MAQPPQNGFGQMRPEDFASDHDVQLFSIKSVLGRMRTAQLAKVVSVLPGTGGNFIVGVQPLVNQLDGQGNSQAHGTINNVPVVRMSSSNGGIDAVPVPGDVGLIVVCDRDISAVTGSNGKVANPGSRRIHDLSDSIYIGSLFGAALTQFVKFDGNGITVSDKNGNTSVFGPAGVNTTDLNNNSIVTNASGISLTDKFGNSIVANAAGMTLTDRFGNTIVLNTAGVAIADTLGQFIKLTPTGWNMIDLFGQTFASGSLGVSLSDKNANVIVMQAGSVNIITPVLQVNGVPVTVP